MPDCLHSTKSASGLGPADKEINYRTDKREKEYNQDPDDFLKIIEAFVCDGME
jgi:hypothetical protein